MQTSASLSHAVTAKVNPSPLYSPPNPKNIKPRLAKLYYSILLLWENEGAVRAYDAYFAEKCNRSEATVRRWLRELILLGLIRVEHGYLMRRLIFILPVECTESDSKPTRKCTKTAQTHTEDESLKMKSKKTKQGAQVSAAPEPVPTPKVLPVVVSSQVSYDTSEPKSIIRHPSTEEKYHKGHDTPSAAWVNEIMDGIGDSPFCKAEEVVSAPPVPPTPATTTPPPPRASDCGRLLLAELLAEGVYPDPARRSVTERPEECRLQLDKLYRLKAKGFSFRETPAAWLMGAIWGRYRHGEGTKRGGGQVTFDSKCYRTFERAKAEDFTQSLPDGIASAREAAEAIRSRVGLGVYAGG